LGELTFEIDADAQNIVDNASLVAIYFRYDTAGFASALLAAPSAAPETGGLTGQEQ
jgi:hypothetical protein